MSPDPDHLNEPSPRPRVLEWFAGIGGLAAAWPGVRVVAAVEIDAHAAAVYSANCPAPVHRREIRSLPASWPDQFAADLWWASPPCTPFTRRGRQRDLDDPRNQAFLHLIEMVDRSRPVHLAIENVVGFETSKTWKRLTDRLDLCGLRWQWISLCPSVMGWPNRRPRVYLIASRKGLVPWKPLPDLGATLDSVLGSVPDFSPGPDLFIDGETGTRWQHALHRVRRDDPGAVTACFTRAYGRSPIRSGSWLVMGERLRRFAPAEVAALLGFPPEWKWPATLSTQRRWQLLGNSLSLPAVRYVIDHLEVREA